MKFQEFSNDEMKSAFRFLRPKKLESLSRIVKESNNSKSPFLSSGERGRVEEGPKIPLRVQFIAL